MVSDIVLVADGRRVIVLDPEKVRAFPENIRVQLVIHTADSIADLMMLDEMSPILISSGESTQVRINERRRGLEVLVSDVDSEVKAAIKRFRDLTVSQQSQRILRHMVG